ncbi:MAG: hypothetical protein PHQ60_05020 [Sideroxydans sp.]|nr:hypothetical protein [Sideroxydans sp.]
MKFSIGRYPLVALIVLLVSACGGGGGGGGGSTPTPTPTPTPTSHAVNISWTANREAAVNSLGGGYIVAISGQTPITVPYASGVAAPTTLSTTLMSGSYSATITAYSALGTSGSTSLPSATYSFSVPY